MFMKALQKLYVSNEMELFLFSRNLEISAHSKLKTMDDLTNHIYIYIYIYTYTHIYTVSISSLLC